MSNSAATTLGWEEKTEVRGFESAPVSSHTQSCIPSRAAFGVASRDPVPVADLFPPRARRRVNRNGRAFRLRPLTRRRARFGVESPVLWASRRPPSRYGRLCITGRRTKRRSSMARVNREGSKESGRAPAAPSRKRINRLRRRRLHRPPPDPPPRTNRTRVRPRRPHPRPIGRRRRPKRRRRAAA